MAAPGIHTATRAHSTLEDSMIKHGEILEDSTFKAYVLESTLLVILNPALTSMKHILKVSGHSTKGGFDNSPCMLDILMCTFKAYVLESTLLVILNPALTSKNHILKVSGHSTKGGL